MWIDYILLIHSSADELWGCFHLLTVTNNAVINIHVQVPAQTHLFMYLA